MSGGSSGGGSQTTTSELPAYAQPYAQSILQQGANLSNQAMPQYGGELAAPLSGQQQQGMNQISQMASGDPTLQAANGAVQGQLNNGGNNFATQNVQAQQNPLIGPNPYLQSEIGQAQGDLTTQYKDATAPQTMAQFRNGGAFGGSAMQQYQDTQNKQLGEQLNNVSSTMLGNDYANSQNLEQQGINLNAQVGLANSAQNSANYNAAQGRQLSAAGMAPGLDQAGYFGADQLLNAGQIGQQNAQNQDSAAYQQWYNQAYSPYQQLGVLQSALSGAMGSGAQGVSSQTQSGGSSLGNYLGLGETGLGLLSKYGGSF
jgi:hypothetical protein